LYDYNFAFHDKCNVNLIFDRRKNIKMKLKLLFEI